MKIVIINGIPYGSTGTIVRGIKSVAEQNLDEIRIFYSWTKKLHKSSDPTVWIGSFLEKFVHVYLGRLLSTNGSFSVIDTLRMIRILEKYEPDVVNLHILHCWNINLYLLFRYLKKSNVKVFWTMHDCWAFTGKCPHYVMAHCDKWKNGCYRCSQVKQYPQTLVDTTEMMWKRKKRIFTSLDNMVIITPSNWLKEQVKESFLAKYPIEVINNGIDLETFHYVDSDWRKKYNCQKKFLILGVAFEWGKRKGLDVFIRMAKELDPDLYQIVLVGVKDEERTELPDNIIAIAKTDSQKELAELYSTADVFVNPTREDTFPTVNMESLACGTPVITFRTGGSPEILDETSGVVVECEDIDGILDNVKQLRNGALLLSRSDCRKRAMRYDKNEKFKEYVNLFYGEKKS